MSPFVSVVIFFLAVLFIILSLVPLLNDSPDVSDLAEPNRTMSGMPDTDLMNLDK